MIAFTAADPLARVRPSLDHLLALTDRTGTIQHATYDVPNRSTGYCTDDVARALIVAIRAGRARPEERPAALGLARTSLAFLAHAQIHDGRFHNFMSYERTWLDDAGSEDSIGRAVWALGVAMRSAPTFGFRAVARDVLMRALPSLDSFVHLRGLAFAALGLVEAIFACDERPSDAGLREPLLAAARVAGTTLAAAFDRTAGARWRWFEDVMTYDNARLSEALLRAGDLLDDARFVSIGAETLRFFAEATVRDGIFVPVGNDGWFARDGVPSARGQQPLEAAALVDAARAAASVRRRAGAEALGTAPEYDALANLGMAWFHGANTLGRSLVTESGACADGIEASGASANAGAESTLAYLSAAYAVLEPLPRA